MLELIAITPSEPTDGDPGIAKVLEQTREMYCRTGYFYPWIGYLARKRDQIVGTCAFVARPHAGRVEIAYFTFMQFEGQGIATAMAMRLIKIVEDADPNIIVYAKTLPEFNSSNHILKKIGFIFEGEFVDPVDGKIWQWERRRFPKSGDE